MRIESEEKGWKLKMAKVRGSSRVRGIFSEKNVAEKAEREEWRRRGGIGDVLIPTPPKKSKGLLRKKFRRWMRLGVDLVDPDYNELTHSEKVLLGKKRKKDGEKDSKKARKEIKLMVRRKVVGDFRRLEENSKDVLYSRETEDGVMFLTRQDILKIVKRMEKFGIKNSDPEYRFLKSLLKRKIRP